MPSKFQLDKAAWQWAETTDPDNVTFDHVRTAYRLNLKPCPLGSCKRNCKGNPLCLNAIGERVWFGKIDDDDWHQIEDPNYERRDDDMFVGLKNLGATCYVNTFLQLWFHNPVIRNALYKFREPDEHVTRDVTAEWSPSSIGGHLQALFALLSLSERRYLDPKDFITHLGLDAGQQQDAQEFSNLFLTLLEDALSRQRDACVRNVIQNQFRGEYAYVTTCNRCGTKSERPSTFYELDLSIKGHKTLDESLKDFLQEEKLEGDNQYMCSSCNSKQNASRKIHLKYLPPVLNLQLLRFVFDKKTGMKKKLNSFIQFPEQIDMTKYLTVNNCAGDSATAEGVDGNSVTYNLTAVLIHRGPTAYSGHYIAHIRDINSKNWFKFNDEEIEKMKGSKLQLGTEDDPEETGAKQKGRCPKGYHSSRNAYMLVYTLNEENPCSTDSKVEAQQLLPAHVLDYVIKDNETFENWVSELMLIRDQNIESGKEKQEEIKETYQKLAFDKLEVNEGEWISLKWLNSWLTDPAKSEPIDNKPSLCKHDKLSPAAAMKLKFVNLNGSESLCNRYEGGQRLIGGDSLCMLCVQQQCHVIRTKIRMMEDDKFFGSMTKPNVISGPSYWVGKASFRSWKKMVLEQLGENDEDKRDSTDVEPSVENGLKEKESSSAKEEGQKEKENTVTTEEALSKEEESFKFNEDILCEAHDRLDPDMTCRKLVPVEVWRRLKEYFANCPEFAKDDPVCGQCNDAMRNEQQTKEYLRKLAQEQKNALNDLLNDRKRPITLKKPIEVFILNKAFLEELRRFIKEPLKYKPIQNIGNSILICEHEGYLYPQSQGQLELYVNDNFVYTWSSEWDKISQMFNVDYEISIISYEDDDKNLGIVTLPQVCDECVVSRLNQEENARFDYDEAVIFVRKIPKQLQKSAGSSSLNPNDENSKDYDPDFNQHGSKKRGSTSDPLEEPPEKISKNENGTRKSQRHRKVRGEKEVKVKSTQTLKDFKLQLMKLFSVPPFDQTLLLNGHSLCDDTATLGGLRIAPGSIIMLQADEPAEDLLVLQDMIQVSSGPESGFKGTGLLGNSERIS
ncbi:ubiquitin carboxyl-terminal hydrolase 48 [Mytilus galloprovincialis]|uniref:Ubiquitin carboxyl-terminal hydrolase 48 n=1 Tax=Mytilus galloprovincialis TaxID=29158 RepID=A0A8B6GIB0_MYTGA|nr:ubiquitin carboxyl-terminal hydrolase 48 [Mytilus galloprovincialis]